ncbi:MAG: hypothetical protein DRN13_03600 [Thermoplasmata archaeon]|nr:MAG: hypothetical protein DRN13_03600 [Thermoplasmata archaeon]
MMLFEDLDAVEPFPVAYIRDLSLLIISDLHLGYEAVSAEHGVFIPKVQFGKIKEMIRRCFSKTRARRILILGDVKHEFSETSYHEYREVSSLFSYLDGIFKEVIVVKGNHDTFIQRMTRRFGIEVYDCYNEDRYSFIHGHKEFDLERMEGDTLVMGHEHPSVALFTDVGVKEKLKVFLYGNHKGKRILVMPSASFFAEGSDVNILPREELISPILRRVDIDSFKAVGILEDDRYLDLPTIGRLRKYG